MALGAGTIGRIKTRLHGPDGPLLFFEVKFHTIYLIFALLPSVGWAGQFDEIAPLLKEHCIKCHGGATKKGGLDLRSLKGLLEGGESGPIFVAGHPEKSRLISQLHPGADTHMPPKGQLSQAEIIRMQEWVTRFRYQEETSEDQGSEYLAETLPSDLSPDQAIDFLLRKRWAEKEISPASSIDDGAFLRRITLDLLGRIPTREEHARFLTDTRPDRRKALIDDLLESEAHARHFAEIFNAALLGRSGAGGTNRANREKHFLPYLRWVFKTNRPWNKVGYDFIVARPETPEEQGASWFLYEQGNDAGKMATTTASALFGTQVQCAQCHDHPVAPEIEQKHYWGLVAFFDRTRNVNTSNGPGLGERAAGGYNKFANLEGESSESELVFLTGRTVLEPLGRQEKDDVKNYIVSPPEDWINPPKPNKKGDKPVITTKVEKAPLPKFSRRRELARLALEDNPAFSRAIVNRLWALLIGRGIVHPVDKMNSANPPSHPALLAWLAKDFSENGFDLRRTCRAILNSRAYSLSTNHPAENPPAQESFARGIDKPLPAEPLYRSILVALGSEAREDGTVAQENTYRSEFVKTYPDIFAENFSPSVQQAMFAANGKVVEKILNSSDLPLAARLNERRDPEVIAEELFLAALGRLPDHEERGRTISYLAQRTDRRPSAIRQILWALFNSAEFRMNH